jgi:hypothetical protein
MSLRRARFRIGVIVVWQPIRWAVGQPASHLPEVVVSSGTVIALVLLAVAAAIVAGALLTRRAMFRQGFGPEYDRMAREVGARRAKAEFIQRRQRVTGLGIKPLTAEQRARYTGEWVAAQERFIDNPPQSAQAAAALVAAVAADRGYQVTDHAQLLSDLSVHHGRWLDGYRQARRTTDGAGGGRSTVLGEFPPAVAREAGTTGVVGTVPDGVPARPRGALPAAGPADGDAFDPLLADAAGLRANWQRVQSGFVDERYRALFNQVCRP